MWRVTTLLERVHRLADETRSIRRLSIRRRCDCRAGERQTILGGVSAVSMLIACSDNGSKQRKPAKTRVVPALQTWQKGPEQDTLPDGNDRCCSESRDKKEVPLSQVRTVNPLKVRNREMQGKINVYCSVSPAPGISAYRCRHRSNLQFGFSPVWKRCSRPPKRPQAESKRFPKQFNGLWD